MMQAARGLIIGGGIAGLATALFARQRGLQLPIYEKNARLECEDHLLWLAPNGLHLLAALGLADAVQAKAVAQDAMLFSSRQLQPLLRLDCQKLARTNGYAILAIKRRELYQIMLDALLAMGGEIHYDQTLTGLHEHRDQLRLEFSGSPAPVLADFAIGADGIGSATRRLLFPRSEVRYQGIRTYLGRSTTPVSARYIGQTIESWGVGTRFVLTSLDGHTTYWSAIERPAVYEKNSAPLPPDLATQMQQVFADYHADVREIVANAVPGSIYRCNFGVVTGLRRCHTDKVCLVGDAAHGMPPNMGQGASLGLEDAYLLVDGLATGKPVAKVFRQHCRQRSPRVRQMVQLANGMNTLFQPPGHVASMLRDYAAAAMPDGLSQRRMAQLYQVPFRIRTPVNGVAGGGVP